MLGTFLFYVFLGQSVVALDATQTVSPFAPYFPVIEQSYPKQVHS